MKKQILIVDDEEEVRTRVTMAFLGLEFVVWQAGSVEEAIIQLHAHPEIQLILLDLEFKFTNGNPFLTTDGTKVLEHIRPNADRYRVIVLTAHEEYLNHNEARSYGVFSYMPKSVSKSDESLIFEVERAFWDLERSALSHKLEKHFDIQRTIAADVSSEATLNFRLMETLELVCKSALEIVRGYTCHIRLLDLTNGDFVLAAACGPFANVREIFQERTAISDVFSGRVAESGEEENIGKLRENKDFLQMEERRLRKKDAGSEIEKYFAHVRSAYIVPISTRIFENRVDAVLNISSTVEDYFTPERCDVVNEFRIQAEIAITKVWLRIRKEEAQKDYSYTSELLVKISEQLRKENDLQKVYEIVASGIADIVNPELISIFRQDPPTNTLVHVFDSRGDTRDPDIREVFESEESLTGKVFATGESIRLPCAENPISPTEDPRYDSSHEQVNRQRIPSQKIDHYLAVPVKFGKSTIGVIRAVNKKSGYYSRYMAGDASVSCLLERGFSKDCQHALETIGSHLGVAELFNRKINQLQILTHVARTISSDTEADIGRMLAYVVRKAAEVTHAEICMLFLKEVDQDQISLRECYGMPMIEGASYQLGVGKTGKVASDGESILESQADPHYSGKFDEFVTQYLRPNQDGNRVIKSFMAVPISIVERRKTDQPGQGLPRSLYKSNGEAFEDEREIFSADPSSERIIGVLKVFNKTYGAGEFDDDDLSILATFASQIGVVFAFADRGAALSDLAEGVCHEIRNKIGTIKQNLGLVKEGLSTDLTDNKTLAESTNRIQAAANEASEFTNMVLGFAIGHFQRPQRLDINPLINEALNQIKPNYQILTEENDLTTIEDYCPEQVICSVFRTPFIHIIQNIVSNAYEAMNKTNAGTLTISTSLNPSKSAVLIKISDTGRGISPEDLPNIYKSRFYRRPGGNGLGLWLVRRFLPQMDGIISVESTVNVGTTFTIQMPIVTVETS